jgi:hypothetical protein
MHKPKMKVHSLTPLLCVSGGCFGSNGKKTVSGGKFLLFCLFHIYRDDNVMSSLLASSSLRLGVGLVAADRRAAMLARSDDPQPCL